MEEGNAVVELLLQIGINYALPGFVALVVVLTHRRTVRQRAILKGAARALELQWFSHSGRWLSPGEVCGAYKGVQVLVDAMGQGSFVPWRRNAGKRVQADAPKPLGLGIEVEPRSVVAGALARSREVKVGDAAFDATFQVRAGDGVEPSAVLRVLNAQARACLMRLSEIGGTVRVSDTGAEWTCAGFDGDGEALAEVADACVGVVRAMSEAVDMDHARAESGAGVAARVGAGAL